MRVVEYTVPDRNPGALTDPHEVAALDEIKTDLHGRAKFLRSKLRDLVEQQMGGLMLAHYAIRALLLDAADPAGYDPDRMSSVRGLRVVRRQVTDQAAITP